MGAAGEIHSGQWNQQRDAAEKCAAQGRRHRHGVPSRTFGVSILRHTVDAKCEISSSKLSAMVLCRALLGQAQLTIPRSPNDLSMVKGCGNGVVGVSAARRGCWRDGIWNSPPRFLKRPEFCRHLQAVHYSNHEERRVARADGRLSPSCSPSPATADATTALPATSAGCACRSCGAGRGRSSPAMHRDIPDARSCRSTGGRVVWV